MEKIRSLTKSMIMDIDDFLNQGAVQILIANGNQVKTGVLGQGGGAKIERLRGAMHPAVSRRLVGQMRGLEEKIGGGLVGVENVMRPVRMRVSLLSVIDLLKLTLRLVYSLTGNLKWWVMI